MVVEAGWVRWAATVAAAFPTGAATWSVLFAGVRHRADHALDVVMGAAMVGMVWSWTPPLPVWLLSGFFAAASGRALLVGLRHGPRRPAERGADPRPAPAWARLVHASVFASMAWMYVAMAGQHPGHHHTTLRPGGTEDATGVVNLLDTATAVAGVMVVAALVVGAIAWGRHVADALAVGPPDPRHLRGRHGMVHATASLMTAVVMFGVSVLALWG
ncbi:DUF5134 domain-containing protein [Streptomyces olindensis]|uniref:DUF5134 domain-containing protein n=1 Tax=Streptomyces olindensis TaxID=358823 RepID=UPI0036BDA2EA